MVAELELYDVLHKGLVSLNGYGKLKANGTRTTAPTIGDNL